MSKDNSWQFDLEEYIKQGEPDQAEKSTAWKTAIGLQDVDGLKTSAYLLETAKEHFSFLRQSGKLSTADYLRAYLIMRVSSGLIILRKKNGC